ncbi:hypothetical protein L484_011734 [Morus notabilis]|uniref:Uncharacterized protein n=1 Tax=Morus notabilis TaxID=981085 RepID=W9RLW9_9ROSA|nr:hypothetical protein L484_011734 [Morus notabilis]
MIVASTASPNTDEASTKEISSDLSTTPRDDGSVLEAADHDGDQKRRSWRSEQRSEFTDLLCVELGRTPPNSNSTELR